MANAYRRSRRETAPTDPLTDTSFANLLSQQRSGSGPMEFAVILGRPVRRRVLVTVFVGSVVRDRQTENLVGELMCRDPADASTDAFDDDVTGRTGRGVLDGPDGDESK